MTYNIPTNRVTFWLISFLILLGIGTFVYNQYLINNLLQKERSRVELWAKAIEYNGKPQNSSIREEISNVIAALETKASFSKEERNAWVTILRKAKSDLSNAGLEFVSNELIIKNRFEIPSVVVSSDGTVLYARNTEKAKVDEQLLAEFRSQNEPIEIEVGEGKYSQKQYVYYGESPTVKLLRFFPYIQFGLLALLLGIGYVSYNSLRKTEQSNLWVGMAKEAAHQLGTPLSGLYGWIAVLKDLHNDEETQNIIKELENDTQRLQSIASRFNKIGSLPELEYCEISPLLNEIIVYMKRRLPQLGKHVNLHTDIGISVKIPVNPELFKWAIENLVKNAMDAINKTQKESFVSIEAHRIENDLVIDIQDSGIGIEKKYHDEVFKPGYSTKTRGWGLGLSLTRRIIEEYHNGDICVLESTPGEGTTIRVMLPIKQDIN